MDYNLLSVNFLLIGPFMVAFISGLVLTYLFIPIIKKLRLVDDPKIRNHPAHTHTGVIPRSGGLAIFLAILIPVIIFLPMEKGMLGIIIGALIIVMVGVLDDKYDLSPYFRFVTNIIVALVVVGGGVAVSYITNPLGGVLHLDFYRISFDFVGRHSIVVFSDIFAVLWIVWCMNMVNWSKGVDGQMPGFVAISALVIGFLSLRLINNGAVEQLLPASLSFITAGAFLGFLVWNFYPQKIMPGYGGGSLAGYMLAILAILSGAKVGTAVLVLGVPMIDAVYTIVRRIYQKKSPFWGDRGHLHHKLLSLGWGRRRIALCYWLFSAILGIIALTVTSKIKLFVIFLLAVFLGGTLLWLSFFTTFSKRSDQDNG